MKNIINDLAIVVPSYNRHDYLNRIASFYSDFDINVYILDSTSSEAHLNLPKNVHYKWVPQQNFSQKILFQIEELSDIPYIALIADDDFVKYESLIECYEAMADNSNYVMANGIQYLFKQDFDEQFYYNHSANGFEGTHIIKNDEDGIRFYWNHYQNIIWSLFKRDILLKAFRNLVDCNFTSGNFPEMLIRIEVLRSGYVYMSEHPFNYMEINPSDHWGTTSPSISWHSYWTNQSLKNDVQIFKKHFRDDELALKCINLHMGTQLDSIINIIVNKIKMLLVSTISHYFRKSKETRNGFSAVSDVVMSERLARVFCE